MILGIGCDLVEIARIEKSIERENFIAYCFSQSEQLLFAGKPGAARRFAGCYAAKEAFGKALGTGVRGFSLNEISVLRNNLGKPYIALEGKALMAAEKLGAKAHVTISNTDALAMAVVVLEEK